MTTDIKKSERAITRHDVTLTVTPDDDRVARIARSMRSPSKCSPYEMTQRRAEKCVLLLRAGFDCIGRRYTHSSTDHIFSLSEACITAQVLLGREAA